jgi:hypothetical protein
MKAQQLAELATVYQEHREYITNEETAKMSLVVPFIRLLGFEPNNPREVRLEFSAEFTQGDGKRHADRMDFAIFDKTGKKPLMVVETKPLNTDLQSKAHQLARYIAQMPELRFGIITDGCVYYFYGDLTEPNVMDKEPFFTFSLSDEQTDWEAVTKFLNKFSRDSFNAETLVTDAENSRYKQAIVDKLTTVLKNPAEHEDFLKWLTKDIYTGMRTASVMKRLGRLASESIEPTLMRVMGDDFVEKLRERIRAVTESDEEIVQEKEKKDIQDEVEEKIEGKKKKHEIVTTEEEREFYSLVKTICVSEEEVSEEEILYRDTTNYFNVSYKKPSKWFIRFFGDARRKNISTQLPVEEVKELAPNFEVEEAPSAFGTSRIYINSTTQILELKDLVIRCLKTQIKEQ